MTIFIPHVLHVGFQNRKGTYSGRLAYVIYEDEKKTVRKKESWDSWRDDAIPPQTFDNSPREGFVLNRQAGGLGWSSWNHRLTYVRVYDPRGFEVEIQVPNLLYILENTSSIKGKGLEGELVYGWDGTELVLVPTSSPDYPELLKYRDSRFTPAKKIGARNIREGATYVTNKNERVVFLERATHYNWYQPGVSAGHATSGLPTGTPKTFFFYNLEHDESKYHPPFTTMRSVNGRLIREEDPGPHPQLADMVSEMERWEEYSPIDQSKTLFEAYSIEEFTSLERHITFWSEVGYSRTGETKHRKFTASRSGGNPEYVVRPPDDMFVYGAEAERLFWSAVLGREFEPPTKRWDSFSRLAFEGDKEQIFAKFKPLKRVLYLANGLPVRDSYRTY